MNRPVPDQDQSLFAAMDQLVRQMGADPEVFRGKLLREIVHTTAKLQQDRADGGEVKLISRSLKELRYALKVFRPYRKVRKIAIFGSARTPKEHPDYLVASEFAHLMASAGWMVITGAGDGIMRAGHSGAGKKQSFGVSIRLPFETNANEFIAGDPKLITFRYFFTRKLMFMWQSHAVALFPGGFGTQDEGFEALTLIQTGKAPLVPIVCVDPPGGDYWTHWDNYVSHSLRDYGWINSEDQNLYRIFDNPAAAAEHVHDFYRNYHSQRFVRDTLVLRMFRELTAIQLQSINEEFSDLVQAGRIEQGGPLNAEKAYLELPRLYFEFTKQSYGRLRLLIDRINYFDRKNTPDLPRY